jgi:hypothetical protein
VRVLTRLPTFDAAGEAGVAEVANREGWEKAADVVDAVRPVKRRKAADANGRNPGPLVRILGIGRPSSVSVTPRGNRANSANRGRKSGELWDC